MNASKPGSFAPFLKGCVTLQLTVIILASGFTIRPAHSETQIQHASARPAPLVQDIKDGKRIFLRWCRFCHGRDGQGDGPAAEYLKPRPRNFTSGTFKLRSTASGALPTDEDLFHTIKNGIPGTAMPAFGKSKNGLSDNHIRKVIYFLQTLSDLWTDDDEFSKSSDPDDREDYRYNRVEKISSPPLLTQKLMGEGARIYNAAKCYECHGKDGRGDGETAYNLKDDWNEAIFPRDLHKCWRYKRGCNATDIFRAITTGMNGTPMPSFKKALPEQSRWALSFYIASLASGFRDRKLLKVKYSGAEIPSTPEDPLWQTSEKLEVPLSGQVLTTPRWPIHSVDLVEIRALYNDKSIAFLLCWDDRRKDAISTKQPDGLALQFFSKTEPPLELPHFLNGSPNKKVDIWYWKAAEESINSGQEGVREFSVSGPEAPLIRLATREGQRPDATSFYSSGQWKLLIVSPLTNRIFSDAGGGLPLSLALSVWDGSTGESGLKKSISSWRWIRLLPRKSKQLCVYPILTFLITFIPGILILKRLSPHRPFLNFEK